MKRRILEVFKDDLAGGDANIIVQFQPQAPASDLLMALVGFMEIFAERHHATFAEVLKLTWETKQAMGKKTNMNDEVIIRLTRDEFDALLIMAGYAWGAAHQQKHQDMALMFSRLANAINRDNPNWVPYQINEDSLTTEKTNEPGTA